MKHILKCHPILKTDFIKGEGCYLYDGKGKSYLDCESGLWCSALGHSHARITETIGRQSGQLINIGFRWGTQEIEQAATALLEVLSLAQGKCVFLSSGSEAMDLAIKLAQVVSHRSRFVCLEPSYLAAYGQGADTGSPRWLAIERDSETCSRAIDWLQIAAFVLELGSAAGAVHFPARGLITETVESCRKSGGLIVVDEVTTGMGRTGRWFGYQHFGIEPDIVAVGKGLGNGYPVSAVAVSQEVAAQIEASGLHYVQSHQNDPLGCAVAQAVIDVMQGQDLIQRSRDQGKDLLTQLRGIQDNCPAIADVRGKGLMVAVELSETIKAGDVFEAMLARGFLVGCNPSFNCIRLMPPLIIGQGQIAAITGALKDVLS